MENVVLFGGTFDPIHNGHLRIARAASMFLNADVIFVPAKNPPGKEPIASPEQRLSMLRLALKADGSSSFSISLFEMKSKEQVNYWVDTVSYFAAKCKHAKLYFLIGADDDKVAKAKEIIKEYSQRRMHTAASTAAFGSGLAEGDLGSEVAVGGAIVFVLDVESVEKY